MTGNCRLLALSHNDTSRMNHLSEKYHRAWEFNKTYPALRTIQIPKYFDRVTYTKTAAKKIWMSKTPLPRDLCMYTNDRTDYPVSTKLVILTNWVCCEKRFMSCDSSAAEIHSRFWDSASLSFFLPYMRLYTHSLVPDWSYFLFRNHENTARSIHVFCF